MTFSHVIWDFNGTLLNDVATSIKTINALLLRRNMKTIDNIEDYYRVFCFPIINYYRNLEFDFDKESYNDISIEWVKEYLINVKDSTLYDGSIEILSAIKNHGIPQIILSATEKEILLTQVNELGIKDYFEDILGLDNIHAYSKVNIAKAWRKVNNPQKAVLIGDTTHDFDVAKAMEIDCILIANGHQSKKCLQDCGVLVVDNISELLEVLL
jgi:phosphoglycolate phosphatase